MDVAESHGQEGMVFADGRSLGFDRFGGFQMAFDGVEKANEVPHAGVTVLVQLSDVVEVGEGGLRSRAVLVGLAERPVPTRSSGTVDCVEVRLSPLAAFDLLGGMTMSDLSGEVLDLGVLLGGDVDSIIEEAAAARSWVRRFEIVNRLFELQHARHVIDPEVRQAWSILESSGGNARVQDLCGATGWSSNRLRKRFETQIGVTPKRAGRLIRFGRAHRYLSDGISPAAVAAQCGFVDQSHLHRDVTAFAGMTPAELRRAS